MMMKLLEGVRVLDMSMLLAGLSGSFLADLGADVIKIESLPVGDYLRSLPPTVDQSGMSATFSNFNRNKRSVALNLRADAGRQALLDLVATADVVMESARPGARAHQGVDYESLVKVKPDLIYCSISGFGQTGPYRQLTAHGYNVDAASGIMSVIREPGRRPEIRFGSGVAVERGAWYGALAVLAALVQKGATGKGQYLDVSCWDAGVHLNNAVQQFLNATTGNSIEAFLSGGLGPRCNVYGTKDDEVVLLAPIEKKFWVAFCDVIGRPDLATRGERPDGSDLDFDREDDELRDELEAVMRTRTADEWMRVLSAVDIPIAPVPEPQDVVHDAHFIARAMAVEGPAGIRYLRPPMLIPDDGFEVRHRPPRMGEHTDEILATVGYDTDRLTDLRKQGDIA